MVAAKAMWRCPIPLFHQTSDPDEFSPMKFLSLHFGVFVIVAMFTTQFVFAEGPKPYVTDEVVFAEENGIVCVEAEHFFAQTATEKRAFHLVTKDSQPKIKPDGDDAHVGGASGGAYLEALPDTRRTHDDKLIAGENFSNEPGKLAILHYKVNIQTPGRYYVWVRALSTGSEDNGLHVGLNGKWPESGQRLQWCEGKHAWRWESKQRTAKTHCGEPFKIFLDIEKPGEHVIQFSMREDGFEFDRWLMTTSREFKRPDGVGPTTKQIAGETPTKFPLVAAPPKRVQPPLGSETGSPTTPVSKVPLIQPRKPDGDGSVKISGEQKQWHKVTLTLDGPFAHEQDNVPNPFTDYEMFVRFQHESGSPDYVVPAYFAADGNAAESSAQAGTKWRAHLSPDKTGKWTYDISFVKNSRALAPFDSKTGEFTVEATDKTGRDFRGEGRLQYVGKRYLKFAGSNRYFLKAGADAPETLLGYADFDGTIAGKPGKVPLKKFAPHLKDWRSGDPTWQGEKGKGLIGAVNYLSGKGCNAFSFLTYNAGGDGDNVWPFIARNDKMHYDCSKLDQWGIVFDHATAKGMYLHFKMQETENDDKVPTSLDGGDLGPQRKLYCRELIARFGHNLALNWNLSEESTQTTEQQKAMINYIASLDAYGHNIVIHTYPDQQDKVYRALIGDKSQLTGTSLQNSNIKDTHRQVVKWVEASEAVDKPWIVAFDESGSAAHGQCPDLGYQGFDGRDNDGKKVYTEHEVRRQTLWGTLLGGGAGVEYYFGYKFVENDLICEDWRSRDRSWDYCRIALNFFAENEIPFVQMRPADELVGNEEHGNDVFCLAKPNDVYLVYLPFGGKTQLNLSKVSGKYSVEWFNPRTGGDLTSHGESVTGGKEVSIGVKTDGKEDWLAVIRKVK